MKKYFYIHSCLLILACILISAVTASDRKQSLKTTKTKPVFALTESIRKKATKIKIPSIRWNDITVSNALKELEMLSAKYDIVHKGIRIQYRST